MGGVVSRGVEACVSSLLAVRTTFFCGNKLCSDYKQKWATLLKTNVAPMLADGSIFGVFFVDEAYGLAENSGAGREAVDKFVQGMTDKKYEGNLLLKSRMLAVLESDLHYYVRCRKPLSR